MKKSPKDIIILNMCTKNYDQMIKVPEIWYMTDGKTNGQMDGQMGRQTQKKSNIEVGALPKNKDIFSS